MTGHALWLDLPLTGWSDTCETLLRWTQIAGKVRLKQTPLINHWWNVTFFVNSRGLVAPANPYSGGTFDIVFDLTGIIFTSSPAMDVSKAWCSCRCRSPISTPHSWSG